MKTSTKLFAALVIILLSTAVQSEVSPQEAQGDPIGEKPVQTVTSTRADAIGAAILDQTFVTKSGDEILYSILIPTDYDPATAKPLIMALHYGGEVTPHYARGIIEKLVAPGLHELNAIVVAPDSIADHWGAEENEKMVLELIDFINKQYNIDQEKTLLTGFSMGGYGTWQIGSLHQDLFSAMITVAGQPYVKPDVEWTTPIYAINSRADTIVAIEPTEEYVANQKEQGNELITLVIVEGLSHYETVSFAVPLSNAVPWVKEIWNSDLINK